jgi:hypothetical protein
MSNRNNNIMTFNMDNKTVCNQKTRLCKNAHKPTGCPFGDKCHYAHSTKELRIMDCAYKETCVFIEYTDDGKCTNKTTSNSKICYFRHPNEADDEYHDRIENNNQTTKQDDLTPIKLDMGKKDETWSSVVKKKNTSHRNMVTEDSNPYSILEREDMKIVTLPPDINVINAHVRKLFDDKATEITFKVSY